MADKPRRKRYAEWPGATEYQRRQARGRALGLTPSQAAGKPKQGEAPVSLVRRLWEGLFGKPKRERPKREPGVFDGGGGLPPRPPAPPVPPPPEEPEPTPPPRPPSGGGPRRPGDTPSDTQFPVPIPFDQLATDLNIGGLAPINTWDGRTISPVEARRLLWLGWFDRFADFDTKAQARQDFLDYTGMVEMDLWDAWREWYGEAA